VPSLDLDVETLAERRFRFVKIAADVFLADPIAGRRLAARLERAGIALVVEKIEDERTVVRLLDHHEGLAQGYLFGQPRPAREFLA
jgi:cyclic-di-GMP phosphodiesterase TipF (flagellum assembly factor)